MTSDFQQKIWGIAQESMNIPTSMLLRDMCEQLAFWDEKAKYLRLEYDENNNPIYGVLLQKL